MTPTRLRIGTRASALARWQAHWVARQLTDGGVQVELIPISTRGDDADRTRVAELGIGVFTKELERALLDGAVDVAVHSLKDLPTTVAEGLVLAAIPERESPRDVLVSRQQDTLERLMPHAVIGTSSQRRRAQLLHVRPDLEMRDIRGNVDTRLEKVAAGQYDAVVLAEAGLKRLALESRITQVLGPELVLPAAGQGALAIETRIDDEVTRRAVVGLDHELTRCAVVAERALLAALSAGCSAPVGAWAQYRGDGPLNLRAVVLSLDGRQRLTATSSADGSSAEQLGRDVAGQLLAEGAAALIRQSRGQS
jgi:hydroxymethylbilane synthase